MNKHEVADAKLVHDATAPKADADKTKEELIAELVALREKCGELKPPAQPYQEYPKVMKKVQAETKHAPLPPFETVTVHSKEEEDALGSGWDGPDAKGHKPAKAAPKPDEK